MINFEQAKQLQTLTFIQFFIPKIIISQISQLPKHLLPYFIDYSFYSPCQTASHQYFCHYIKFESKFLMQIRIPQSLKDEQMVDLQDFAQQMNSVSIIPTTSQSKKKVPRKTASFKHIEDQLSTSKSRKNITPNSFNSRERETVVTTQSDESPALLNSRLLRSSRLKQSFERRRKKKQKQLKDVITNQKVKIITQAFAQKLKRNNIYSRPVNTDLYNQQKTSLLDKKGFELKEIYEKIFSIIILVNILVSIFIYSLAMVFQDFQARPIIKIAEVLSFFLFLFEICINLTTVRFSLGRKLETYRDISEGYKRQGFYLDIANLIIAFISIFYPHTAFTSMRLITLFKFPDCMQKLEKLQVYFIENYYYEQYWSLMKVLLFNFCFAHMLSIILLEMANLNHSQNWMITKQIESAEWYQQYIWAYYWGTTVMLTIGFGDIVPVTYKEACCMILIQTISCVVLSYNISCVGALITNIRSKDIQRGKNLKIFKKLADKNNINEDLTWKINNYIEQHVNIKKLFNIEDEVRFVEKLPPAYRIDYLKQANKTVFQNLLFFNNIMEKTLFSLAEAIQTKITHPQQLILNMEHSLDLLILKNGEVGYISRKHNRSFSNLIVDKISIKQNGNPFLLHANFITKDKCPFQIKSIIYSVIYSLQYESLIDILRDSNLDFELYCQLRDKSRHKLDEFEVVPCSHCKTKHTKFICPKYHFMPLRKHVIDQYLFNQKVDSNERISCFQRDRGLKESCLLKYLQHSAIYERKISEEKDSAAHKNIKKEKFIINQLKPLQNQGTSKIHQNQIEAIQKMQIKFLQNTTELMKCYASKMKMIGTEVGEDQIWQVSADQMKNYRHYFSQDNYCNLQHKFDVNTRSKTLYFNSAQEAEKQLYKQAREAVNASESARSFVATINRMTSMEMNLEYSDSSKLKL